MLVKVDMQLLFLSLIFYRPLLLKSVESAHDESVDASVACLDVINRLHWQRPNSF